MNKKRSKNSTQKTLVELFPNDELRKKVVDRLYNGDPILGKDSIFSDMLQSIVNAALQGEIDAHLQDSDSKSNNRKNGYNKKTARSSAGPLSIKTPRDREGTFQPQLLQKWDREIDSGIDEHILSLYACGNSIEDIKRQLSELYGLEISSGTISAVTDKVWDEITEWQRRPLAACYTIVYLDAIHYKVRHDGKVISKAVYTCYGITANGQRDLLSLHLSEAEGSRHWGLIIEDLKRRGVEEVLFFCIDGLKGFKEVIEEIYPQGIVQRCIVHKIRNSTKLVSHKHRKKLCGDLRKIYTAANIEQAKIELENFSAKWDGLYPEVSKKWRTDWEDLMQIMNYSDNLRRMIYTTNPVEALHRIMRKNTKAKGAWSNDKGLLKQLYLSLDRNKKSWQKKAFNWIPIQRELIDHFGERYANYI